MARFLFILITLLLIVSCEQSSQPLEGVQEEIVNNLTSCSWIKTNIKTLPDGTIFEGKDIWTFNKTGKGSHKSILRYNDGEPTEEIYYFQWSFTTSNFAVICMDIQKFGICYWQIEQLTYTQLKVIEALEDPVLYPGTTKTDRSFNRMN